MEDRIIIHLDMDAFFAAVEERENPQFRGKPLVVGADPKQGRGRGVVSTANYEARKYGIHSAMPISQAYKLCLNAIYVQPNFSLYSNVSANIMRIIREFSPIVEQMSLDEAYIEITNQVGTTQKWKSAESIAQKMRKSIWAKEKLPSSCGVGPNKMIAKIACELAKPNGIFVVTKDEAEKFMESLDVHKIPGVGVKTSQILRSSGFEKIADLKRLSLRDMEDLFGARAQAMYGYVRGVDESPVLIEHEVKSLGKEITFEQDTRDPELLIQTFEQLVKEVAREVAKEGLYYKTIVVRCRFSGFETHTKSKTLSKPLNDHVLLRREAMKLFLKFLLEKQRPVRLLGVRVQIALQETV